MRHYGVNYCVRIACYTSGFIMIRFLHVLQIIVMLFSMFGICRYFFRIKAVAVARVTRRCHGRKFAMRIQLLLQKPQTTFVKTRNSQYYTYYYLFLEYHFKKYCFVL